MKNFKKILLIILLTFSINNIVAQFGNNGIGNQNGNGGGRMSQMNNNNIVQNDKPAEESDKSKKQRLDKIVEKLTKDLTLDELQVYGVKAAVEDSMKKQAAIFKKEKPEDEKIADLQTLSESTDRKIIEFLNKQQKVKYLEMNAERKEKLQELLEKRNR